MFYPIHKIAIWSIFDLEALLRGLIENRNVYGIDYSKPFVSVPINSVPGTTIGNTGRSQVIAARIVATGAFRQLSRDRNPNKSLRRLNSLSTDPVLK